MVSIRMNSRASASRCQCFGSWFHWPSARDRINDDGRAGLSGLLQCFRLAEMSVRVPLLYGNLLQQGMMFHSDSTATTNDLNPALQPEDRRRRILLGRLCQRSSAVPKSLHVATGRKAALAPPSQAGEEQSVSLSVERFPKLLDQL